MQAPWVALILLAVPLAGCMDEAPPPDAGPSTSTIGEEPATGPFWSFVDTQGTNHTRDTAAGDPTVLFFMATWCSSCQRLTRDLNAVHPDYVGQGVDFFSITWDPSEDNEDLEAWKERFDQPWPHGIDPSFEVQRTFGVRSQSTVIVLDGDGHLVKHFGYGQANADNLPTAIDEALARSSTPASA